MAKKTGAAAPRQLGLRESFGNSKKADWSQADAESLRDAIASVARTGGALRLGYSRDGGAYAIGVYGDGDPYTLYIPPGDDIDDALAKIENAFAEL
jgi:hypothetical protein